MPLLQVISSIGVKAAGCMDGMGWKSWGRGGEGIWEGKAVGEGIWKAKPLEKASGRQSCWALVFASSVWTSPTVV